MMDNTWFHVVSLNNLKKTIPNERNVRVCNFHQYELCGLKNICYIVHKVFSQYKCDVFSLMVVRITAIIKFVRAHYIFNSCAVELL